MEQLARLEKRRTDLGELRDIIGAMRSLAAVRVGEARTMMDGVRAYAAAVDDALAQAIPLLPYDGAPAAHTRETTLAIAFCGEHGFVGGFNDNVLDAARELTAAPGDGLLVVGDRGARIAEESGLDVLWWTAQAARAASLAEVARRVADELGRRFTGGDYSRVMLVFTRASGTDWRIEQRSLLPFDFAPYRSHEKADQAPLHNLPSIDLMRHLIDEFIFGEITRATVESYAAEHTARLTTMDAADRNIERKLEELELAAHQSRQTEITAELLDIVTGVEALMRPGNA